VSAILVSGFELDLTSACQIMDVCLSGPRWRRFVSCPAYTYTVFVVGLIYGAEHNLIIPKNNPCPAYTCAVFVVDLIYGGGI